MGLLGKVQSTSLVGVGLAQDAVATNATGALVTAISISGTPIDGIWSISVVENTSGGTQFLQVRNIEGSNTKDDKRILYTAGALTTLINGLTITTAGSQATGANTVISVSQAIRIGAVKADNSQGAIFVGSGMKVVTLRTAAQGAITADTYLNFDCRGYMGVSFWGNVTAITGSPASLWKLFGGMTLLPADTTNYKPISSLGILRGSNGLNTVSGLVSAVFSIPTPYLALEIFGTGGANITADIYAILHSGNTGFPVQAAYVTGG